MNDFFSFEASVRHKVQSMDRFAEPSGRLEGQDGEAYASMIKYVARHVSAKLPQGKPMCDDNCSNCHCLRTSWEGRNQAIPPVFREMVDALLQRKRMDLPDKLYEAAFCTEIKGRNYMEYMSVLENQRAVKIALLQGAGYNVY